MKKLILSLVLLVVFTFTLTACNSKNDQPNVEEPTAPTDEAVEINISAAASLTDALTEIQTEYAKESNAVIQFNFASSGALQKQIQEGAPCDLFISASKAHMDTLEQAGLVVEDSRKDLLGNTLTLIASKEKADKITGTDSFTSEDVESISIGTPESVPAGAYAQQTFESLAIWDQVQDKLVFAKDVKQVLEYVDTGNVDCGLVYKSDALLLETGVVIGDMPEDSHDPIVYPAALMTNAVESDAASAFYDFLQTDYAKGIFEEYGFIIL
jgi:molybdate transport system substrate-binding protein